MYWPNGVPRVYAVNGPEIIQQAVEQDDGGTEANGEQAGEREQSSGLLKDEQQGTTQDAGGDAWADEPIAGLCVSKNGALFATMTETSLAIWQTKVGFSAI